MHIEFRHIIVLSLCFLVYSCSNENDFSKYSDNKSDIVNPSLIEPKLARQLLQEYPNKYIPIQVSKKEIFNKEHISNAINIWRPDYGSEINDPFGGLIPSAEKLENLLQSFGFEKGKTLLLYDVKANVDALRFAWVLNLYGFDDFKIINGGLQYWKLNELEVTSLKSLPLERSNYQMEEFFDKSIIANFEEVKAALNDVNTILIDTREQYEFRGLPFIYKNTVLPFKNGAFNRGSIPSAIHLNWSTFADLKGDHRIKSERDLRYNLKEKGINPDKSIILYCHSGSRTSHTFYVLKHILGYEDVKNYDGSWIEWSYKHSMDKSVPILQICSENKFEEKKDSLITSLNNYE